MNRSRVLSAILLLVAQAAASAGGAEPPATADVIVVNGRILAFGRDDRTVEALAVHRGRILAVGSNAEIRALATRSSTVIDLKGRAATPGLIDTHAHISGGGLAMITAVPLSDATSIAEVQRRVAARARTLRPGEWVQGSGWDEGKLAEHRYILASDLDAVAPRNPVWLENTTGHYGVANSLALKLAGIGHGTPDPQAGTIDRDAGGHPTGILKEGARDELARHLPPVTPAAIARGIRASLDLMHREGMTAAKDPDIGPDEWAAYQQLARSGALSAHVCVLWHTDSDLKAVRANIARLAALPKPPAAAAANLVSCGVKMFMDGSGVARTAWMYQDWNYADGRPDAGNHGYPLFEPATFREAVRLYTAAGIHIGTHALGDQAIDWTVDSYAAALREMPTPGLRHAIIHANFPTDHAIETMARLQRDYDAGYPETQSAFIWWLGDNYALSLGAERVGRFDPLQGYLRRGMRWGGGSDFDVTPLPARYGIWASVARETLNATHGPTPFGLAEAVDVKTALRSYTVWAAHLLFLDDEAGSLEVGKSADLAVWDRDPTEVPTAALRDLHCELTLFRGRIVWRAPDAAVEVHVGRH